MTVQSQGFLAGPIKSQGELSVGDGTEQFPDLPCSRVWVGAPTGDHTKAASNSGRILIGGESGGNESGGVPLETDNVEGLTFLVTNANQLYATGFNAGDVVEYMVFA